MLFQLAELSRVPVWGSIPDDSATTIVDENPAELGTIEETHATHRGDLGRMLHLSCVTADCLNICHNTNFLAS